MKVVCNWWEVHSEWLHTRGKLIGYLTSPHSQYRTTEIGSHRKSNTTKSILIVIMQQHTIQMPIWQWKDSLTKDFKEAHPKLSRYSWQGQSQTQRCNIHVQYYKLQLDPDSRWGLTGSYSSGWSYRAVRYCHSCAQMFESLANNTDNTLENKSVLLTYQQVTQIIYS